MAKRKSNISHPDPRWNLRIYSEDTGQDFLGLVAPSTAITDYLLPGIITITPRARYYAFYSWLLVEYSKVHPKGWGLGKFVKRREQIFSLANFAWTEIASDAPDLRGLFGTVKLRNHWARHKGSNRIPLNQDNYIQAGFGGYGSYSGVMNSLRITQPSSDGSGGVDVLPKGQELADAFEKTIQSTAYFKNRSRYDQAESIAKDVLEEFGSKCHLSYLSLSQDNRLTIEVLFGFDEERVLPDHLPNAPTRGNMRGTLGLILSLVSQAKEPINDYVFREAISYGLCSDYHRYRPEEAIEPFVARWRIFQLREMYVFALYTMWEQFLRWLRVHGPATYDAFCADIDKRMDFKNCGNELGVKIPNRRFSNWKINDWATTLLDLCDIPQGEFESRCSVFASRSETPVNEHRIVDLIDIANESESDNALPLAWMLLSAIYLRLVGVGHANLWDEWYWAKVGEARRKSMDIFVRDWSNQVQAQSSLVEVLDAVYRESIIAQHILTSLEKWRGRRVNTFHFNYENGVFEWIQNDRGGYSASRFNRAYDMLRDMGLYETSEEESTPQLTLLGKEILNQTLESLHGISQ